MDSQEILGIVELVVKEQLKLRRAEEVFGPVESRSPTQVRVRPRDSRFEYVILETPATNPEIVISVAIRVAEPGPLDWRIFEKLYGKPRLLPRLKPDQPTPHAFDVTFRDRRGQLVLGLRDDRLVTLKVDRFD